MNIAENKLELLAAKLLERVITELLAKMESGEFSSQDVSNAIKLLHNNGVTVDVKKGHPLDILKENLPFEGDH